MSSIELKLRMNTKITENDITSFIFETAKRYNLDFLINYVTFIDNEAYGYYNPNSLTLNINYKRINNHYADTYTANVKIINSIFNEMTHVAQRYQMYSNNTYKRLPTYYVLIITSYIAFPNDYKFYLDNHDAFILEYTADICSYINTLKLLRRNNIEYNKIEMFNKEFNDKIDSYYSSEIPINNAAKLFKGLNLYKVIDESDINRSVKTKYREALRNCGKEKDLTDAEKFIYGYYPKDKMLKELHNVENCKTKKLNLAKKIGA